MNFNRDKFFDAFRAAFGVLTQPQVDALDDLLAFIESDADMTDVRWIAYALATIKHECANTYRPIAEYGHGKGHPYGIPDPETKRTYYGRGYVQLTWRRNYEKMSELLGVDLDGNPDLAMEPEIAWQILSIGMRDGIFTGKKLRDYIHGDHCDYTQARRIINAMDKAALIADYATKFQAILEASSQDEESTQDEAESAPDEPVEPPVTTSEASTVVTEQSSSVITKIAGNDTVKEIAKSGVTSIGTKVSTGLATGGLLSAIDSFVQQHYAGLIFAGALILMAMIIVLFVMWHKHSQQAQEAAINANPGQHDVAFKK